MGFVRLDELGGGSLGHFIWSRAFSGSGMDFVCVRAGREGWGAVSLSEGWNA